MVEEDRRNTVGDSGKRTEGVRVRVWGHILFGRETLPSKDWLRRYIV